MTEERGRENNEKERKKKKKKKKKHSSNNNNNNNKERKNEAAAAAKEKRGRSLKTLIHLNIIEGFIKFCRRTRSDEKGEDKLEILQ